MSVTKAEITRLMAGKPKKVTRGTAKRIIKLAEQLAKSGICAFPYYSKDAPEDYDAFRGSDTRKMLEREIASPFWYTTGNWAHLFEGHDTMICWTGDSVGEALEAEGFRIRRHDSNVSDESADTEENTAE